MKNHFELIVFDWDGTLMDSAGAIARAIQFACRDMGLPAPSDERARHVIGLGLQEALAYVAPGLKHEDYPRMVDCYRRHYLTIDHDLMLFDGAFELVESLAEEGRLLGVATGKGRKGLDRAFAASGLGTFFHASRCADECFSKPHPEMLEQLMDTFGVDRSRTLMIGDTTHDLAMAENAGVQAVGVGYGAHLRAALEEAQTLAVVDSIADLSVWLRENA
ncbi:MAG TPA: HAD-IA family hydrolase [Azoarcus sp.]|nr:HAD-IA family hydrolase [Azoarcus sp.]